MEDCANKIEMYLKNEDDKTFINKAFNRVWNLYNVKIMVKTYLDNYSKRK